MIRIFAICLCGLLMISPVLSAQATRQCSASTGQGVKDYEVLNYSGLSIGFFIQTRAGRTVTATPNDAPVSSTQRYTSRVIYPPQQSNGATNFRVFRSLLTCQNGDGTASSTSPCQTPFSQESTTSTNHRGAYANLLTSFSIIERTSPQVGTDPENCTPTSSSCTSTSLSGEVCTGFDGPTLFLVKSYPNPSTASGAPATLPLYNEGEQVAEAVFRVMNGGASATTPFVIRTDVQTCRVALHKIGVVSTTGTLRFMAAPRASAQCTHPASEDSLLSGLQLLTTTSDKCISGTPARWQQSTTGCSDLRKLTFVFGCTNSATSRDFCPMLLPQKSIKWIDESGNAQAPPTGFISSGTPTAVENMVSIAND